MAVPDRALWAFDFDGVICDSVGESSISAWRVGYRYDLKDFVESFWLSSSNRQHHLVSYLAAKLDQ
jgi:hypothetical protein